MFIKLLERNFEKCFGRVYYNVLWSNNKSSVVFFCTNIYGDAKLITKRYFRVSKYHLYWFQITLYNLDVNRPICDYIYLDDFCITIKVGFYHTFNS